MLIDKGSGLAESLCLPGGGDVAGRGRWRSAVAADGKDGDQGDGEVEDGKFEPEVPWHTVIDDITGLPCF